MRSKLQKHSHGYLTPSQRWGESLSTMLCERLTDLHRATAYFSGDTQCRRTQRMTWCRITTSPLRDRVCNLSVIRGSNPQRSSLTQVQPTKRLPSPKTNGNNKALRICSLVCDTQEGLKLEQT